MGKRETEWKNPGWNGRASFRKSASFRLFIDGPTMRKRIERI
jgi:hypothetical protein